MKPAVVLHLTDLHFGWEGRTSSENESRRAARKNCLDSLVEHLGRVADREADWRPTVVAVTGDIGWKGLESDYQQAREWLDKLLGRLGLGYDKLVVCPGNHDVDRKEVCLLARPTAATVADEWLQVPIHDFYLNGFRAFTKFCHDAGIRGYDFAGTKSFLVGETKIDGLSVFALNSAWYCRGDDDSGKLWVGWPHLQKLQADGRVAVVTRESPQPVLALVHHPSAWWHEVDQLGWSDRPSMLDVVAKRCHVWLNGHTHGNVRPADRIAEAAHHLTGGAAYAGAGHFNSVRLLRIDPSGFAYRSYEFDPRSSTDAWELKRQGARIPFFADQTSSVADSAPTATAVTPGSSAVAFYLNKLSEATRCLEMRGMGEFSVELPITDAYVPLRTWRAAADLRFDAEKTGRGKHEQDCERPEDRSVALNDVFRECGQSDYRGVMLLGEPGAGKTTGARQLAWRLASGDALPEKLSLPTGMRPVLLKLRNLDPALIQEGVNGVQALREFLNRETKCPGAPAGQQDPGEELWNDPARGLLWILDGLDEVVDARLRAIVAGWIRDIPLERPHDRFLVTCRFQGYKDRDVKLGEKFLEFHVQPLTVGEIQEFVSKWFQAAHRKIDGPGSAADAKAVNDRDELLRVLETAPYQAPSMRELVSNPLLLTIVCIVFKLDHNLPTARAELYRQCVTVLLKSWREEKYRKGVNRQYAQTFDAEAARSVLSKLAWWMHQTEKRQTAPLIELAQEAAKELARISPDARLGLDGAAFIGRMREESGILAMSGEGGGKCGFLHLSFQEYLAAEHAAREGLAAELAPRSVDAWWREVALLSLRCDPPTSYVATFFEQLLAAGIAERNPDLANRCLTESLQFAPEPFVAYLQSDAARPDRVSAVLRLLRDRRDQVPQLGELCDRFVRSSHAEVREMAREILAALGRAPVRVDQEPTPYEVKFDQRTSATLIWIPPGEFQMGSKKWFDDEKPVHQVRLTRGFYLGKYPVTNAEYRRYWEEMSTQGTTIAEPKYWGDRRFNQPEQPVVGVSWDEAAAYCAWAGGRLPTEAEWEYACRAGSVTEYCFSDDEQDLGDYAWYDANSGGQPQPVGGKKPNAWGPHDMHGNVWEWCGDWFADYKAQLATDPVGPKKGSVRVIRGGCWNDTARNCRSAYRFGLTPGVRFYDLGFRLALVAG